MHIIPVASGKGGVGKSMVAANLAIALAQAGKDVVLADIDLGASNLHLIIGLATPRCGIGTWLSRSGAAFEDIIYQTDYPNMRFIPGDAELPGLANLTARQKNLLSKKLLELKADYLILDLGAGTSSNILDFFLLSGRGMVVTAPTLTATLNAYLFLKNIIFRLMWESFKPKTKARNILEGLRRDGSSLQRVYIPDIVARIALEDPESHAIFDQRMQRFNPRLIMNMIDDPKDAERAQKIRRSCAEYLDLQLEHMGIIYRDSMQDVALQARLPILLYKPQSVLSQAIYRIADKLMQSEEDDAPLAERTIEDSFQEAGLEAEVDFEAKMGYVEELLHSGTLTTGDLIETVKTQQFEISQLRKENLFLKSTLTKAISRGFRP